LTRSLILNKEFVISNQLLKSDTSIGANVSETQAVQSTKYFIAKMSIESKEVKLNCRY